jgi:hypothetical protein
LPSSVRRTDSGRRYTSAAAGAPRAWPTPIADYQAARAAWAADGSRDLPELVDEVHAHLDAGADHVALQG